MRQERASMVNVCPRCQASFDPSSYCPRCGVELTLSSSGRSSAATHRALSSGSWQESPGSRVLIGVLLALGLSYGLLQLGAVGLRSWSQLSPDSVASPGIRLALIQ